MSGIVRGTGACRACPAPVLWVSLPSGKRLAVNAEPDDEGNVAAHRDHRGVWVGQVMRADERPAAYQKRFMPHVASCKPVADERAARAAAIRAGTVIPLRRPRAGRAVLRR